MNVLEFIKEKSEGIQENTAQFRAMIEPKFRSISTRINYHISNTMNNPWISNLNPFDSINLLSNEKIFQDEKIAKNYEVLKNKIGEIIYIGQWESIDQDCITRFAEITGDNQWIHTNPTRAESESPFKSTIAHGFLTLSLIPKLTGSISRSTKLYPDSRLVVNYGLNQVRFPFPVKSGSRVRARLKLKNVTPMKKSIEIVNEVSVEVENRKRFGCVAETVLRVYY
tara:strand:+ start:595 stop:1269 length:675 start_codon:yes stop_codon:yes gene_type:complete